MVLAILLFINFCDVAVNVLWVHVNPVLASNGAYVHADYSFFPTFTNLSCANFEHEFFFIASKFLAE